MIRRLYSPCRSPVKGSGFPMPSMQPLRSISFLRDVNHLLKLDPSNTVLLAQKQELLQAAIGDTEKKLEDLEQAQEDVAKAFERGDLGKDQYMAFQREVEETRGTLNL